MRFRAAQISLIVLTLVFAEALLANVPVRPVPTPSLAELPAKSREMIEGARRGVEQARDSSQALGAAFGRLGSRYLHANLLDAASVALENAIALEPEAVPWRYYLAVCHQRRGEIDAAAEQLRFVLSQREGNLPAVLRLADLLANESSSNTDEARALYQAALQSPLGVPAGRAGLAGLAEQEGDLSAAALHLRKALEAQPAATDLHRRLSHVLAAAGRQQDAQRELRLAGEVEVRYPDPLMLQLALEMGDPNVELKPAESESADQGAPAPAPAADAPGSLDAGSAAFLEGDRERGLELLQQAAAENPESVDANLRLASALLVLGRVPDAVESLAKAVELEPTNRRARMQLAEAYFELRRFDDASELLKVFLEGPAADAEYEAHILAGQIAAASQNPDIAERRFRHVADSAVAPKGLRSRAYFNLGLLRQASSRIEEAVALYNQSLDFNANQRQALFNLGLIMASNGRYEEAVSAYQRLFDIQPDNLDVRFRLAVSLMRQGQHWPALGHFEALLKERPDDVETLVSSALLLARVGQADQGRERLESAAARLPAGADRAKALQALGQLQRAAGEKEKGLETLRRAIAAYGADGGSDEAAEAHLELARALAQAGRFDEADRHFGAYVKAKPDNEDAHFARAMALILADRDAQARDTLQAVTSRLPSVPLTHLLARLLAGSPEDSVRDGERAVEIAQTVFERERNPFHGETLAMALAAAGRFEDAITLQERLLTEAKAADFDADFVGRVERNLVRYRAGQPGVFGW